jgi:RNA polymerase sigma factor (sigma-70 family)
VDPDRSFERIYRRHRREVYGSVLRDVRDPDEAEDLTQVAFLNAFRAMRRGDRPEKPRPWLLTIARNVVRRRARLRAERPQEVELDAELFLSGEELEGSAAEDISAALGELTEGQRRAILLREIQGRSYAEIAAELELSVPAIEALIFRARRALVEELVLAEREPMVRGRRSRGLLALPGFLKLGSFGLSSGRVGIASLVGCAVIATCPVGVGESEDAPARVTRNPDARQVAAPVVADARELARPAPAKDPKPRKHRSRETQPVKGSGTPNASPAPAAATDSGSTEPSPVQVPSLSTPPVEAGPVQVPPLSTPSVEVQPVEVPDVEVPDVSDTVEVPDLSISTS